MTKRKHNKDLDPSAEVTPPVPPASAGEAQALVQRDDSGRVKPGSVLNPRGRPKGSKNIIVQERQALEAALREYMNDPKQRAQIMQALARLLEIANSSKDEKVAVQAIKILTDKVLGAAKQEEDASGVETPRVHIEIVNHTEKDVTPPKVVIDQAEDDNA